MLRFRYFQTCPDSVKRKTNEYIMQEVKLIYEKCVPVIKIQKRNALILDSRDSYNV